MEGGRREKMNNERIMKTREEMRPRKSECRIRKEEENE